MTYRIFSAGKLAIAATLCAAAGLRAGPVDFAREVAPLLQGRCLGCHSADKHKGGLRLDSRAGLLKGGNSGPVLTPGKSAGSRLIHLVAGTAEDKQIMPPRGPRLTAAEVGILRAWVDDGALWPDGLVLRARSAGKRETHWAFRPIGRPAPPAVHLAEPVRNPVDGFVLQRLEREGIAPSPEADRRTLIRRVTLDLVGLPPTPSEVEAFVEDTRPDAYERVVDRLLASPHYGEKWARPWLDLCHYGDTDGYLTDQLRPVAWRYRQWLIDALNRDLPYDQFTAEQLAGDLLPGAGINERIATGFLRNTLSNREGGADLEEFRVEQVVDRTMTVATAWLGLTVGCARCHDHKFDPVSQREFYQLYAFFDAADEVNIDAPLPGEERPYRAKRAEYERKRAAVLGPVAKALAELQARWEARLLQAAAQPGRDAVWDRQWEVLGLIWGGNLGEGQLEGTEIVRLPPARRTQDQKDRLLDYFLEQGSVTDPKRFAELKLAELSKKLKDLRKELPPLTRAPTVRQAQTPRQAYVHVRGDFRTQGVAVRPGTPACLPPLPTDAAPDRLTLARWLVSGANPLPARVAVNRAWQEFFGRGLVLTAGDFGTQGERPTHAELLDWLATEYRDGWSTKTLHRLIVTSATYRQSSAARPELAARDPDNRLLARQVPLRLSAEQVRDVTLAVAGLLSRKVGGPSVFPPQPESVAAEGFDNKWTVSPGTDRYRRGLYTFHQRLSPFAQGVTFDAPSSTRICTRRDRSNTPLQALTLLNDPVFFEAARALARRLLREGTADVGGRVDLLFRLGLGRPARPREKERLAAYYRQQVEILRRERTTAGILLPKPEPGVDPVEAAAWAGVSSVVLNLHEFITRD